ncbi:MAG: aminotransferase class I/II-fold pyridoxal phosphate-dependent enzyme [Acidimicrobiales bacterium]|nr:aminotransferase class I/II-fold pyridoxal phosphate-dependent enzyme [Acidimicrobiales bacterium]
MNTAASDDVPLDDFGFDDLDLGWLRAKHGVKWHRHPQRLNAWVADMDFPPPPVVLDALRARVDGADLGYADWGYPRPKSPATRVFAERCGRRYGWQLDPVEVYDFCDVVQAVQTTLHLATLPGDGVVLHTPSYPPLWKSLRDMGRRQIDVPARVDAAGVHFDYDALEQRLLTEQATAILLCHPHNPTGHRFALDELVRIVEIADRFDLLIVSDEIHADLTYDAVHVPIAQVAGAAERTVSVHSASKAFNLAGMRHAVAHVGPAHLRDTLAQLPDHLLGAVNLLAADATVAAWTEGDAWLDAVLAHLDRNRTRFAELLADQLPGAKHRPPAATYLAWVDCRPLGLGDTPVDAFRAVGVELSDGNDFGPLGAGHVRVNLATSSSILERVVATMATASPLP